MTTLAAPHNLKLDRYEFAASSLTRFASKMPSNTVFDIGVGDGRMRKIQQNGFEWYGFDREAWGDIAKWNLLERSPMLDVKAGAILLLDVVEHLANPGISLQHLAEAIQEGGYLILTTPNPRWSASRINMLVRGIASGFSKQDLDENYHVFTPWPHVLERFLSDVGLDIEEYVTLDGWTTPLKAGGKLFFPARIILNCLLMAIEVRDPASKGMSFGLIARKRKGPIVSAPYTVAPPRRT